MKFTEKLIQDMTAGIFKNGLVVSTSSDGQCEYMTLDDDMKKHYYDSCMQTTNKNKLLKQFCENNNIKIIKKFHPAIDSQENEKEYYKECLQRK